MADKKVKNTKPSLSKDDFINEINTAVDYAINTRFYVILLCF